jgi:HD-GYP domain-containing protein (c-di-GMP phosphodiesterase class II)
MTERHSQRVAALSWRILHELRVPGRLAIGILLAARVHDLGKIVVPDALLQKREPLTPEEWPLMRNHAEAGAALLLRAGAPADLVDDVRHHHEAWDGSGYPYGLKGTEIPLGARIIAVADSFDAMISDRPYRATPGAGTAAALLHRGRGRQWAPSIVDALLRSLARQDREVVKMPPPDRSPATVMVPHSPT